jgi:hypothetical protein
MPMPGCSAPPTLLEPAQSLVPCVYSAVTANCTRQLAFKLGPILPLTRTQSPGGVLTTAASDHLQCVVVLVPLRGQAATPRHDCCGRLPHTRQCWHYMPQPNKHKTCILHALASNSEGLLHFPKPRLRAMTVACAIAPGSW